ncbi:AGR316Cp [Eremothecium gossypii ATCC 10895]|uniref:Vacuolar transporter chaperone complex subunit 4 n=1 Tax=Eremothecium gossypii (strain ATCC 10895 / CBS 109.51 / FGSC 9923 / NRRL Y-1056) TaxID=284811 RepID=Q74Z87_EREGS|nr:AGR316Cp [Eremothecium gossypii ATCC 10895]AAS54806.1 AGR316Cp [Eremothecium gossypii ATCC 10895]AEY99138.1 FAGR316Cp [Eremothecium gossypii FDAG1]
MKFGEHLSKSLIREYSYYYISYDDLKNELEENLERNGGEWSSDLETEFLESLEAELDKVYTFCKVKHNQVLRRVKDAEAKVRTTMGSIHSVSPAADEEFEVLEEELSDIIADVHDLAKFAMLNYTGFQKIIKKHDKKTKFVLKPVFQVRMDSKPFFKEDYDEIVVKISQMYDFVRTRGNPARGDASAGGKQQNFVRQTTKYWVHPDNITELKLIILKHLPVLVFNTNKEFEKEDSAITSIYFDNKDLDLYYQRLRKDEGAEAHRLRWYGGVAADTIFVERKTHRESWTGEKSVKARFALKERYVNGFIKGTYTANQAFAKMRKENKKTPQEIDALEALATEIQYTILKKRLRPVMRSFYNRTAFQLPGDARVRISLDTELTMVREDDFDGYDRTNGNWRRMDIGVDWPFKQLPEHDVEYFPYAVLEVKLQTQLGQEPPEWVRELVGSHLVEPVPKFSKFLHGMAALLPNRVDSIPYWLPQMDVDIRKPVITTQINITRPNCDDEDEQDELLDDAGYSRLGNIMDPEERIGYGSIEPPPESAPAAPAFPRTRNDSVIRRKISSTRNPVVRLYYRAYAALENYLNFADYDRPRVDAVDTFIEPPPGKTICVPVRIEPKVYFATERTFLSWLDIGLIFSAISTTLLTYGSQAAMIGAIGFFLTSIGTIYYSAYIYCNRVIDIRLRRAGDYEDKRGPPIVCGMLFASILFVFFCNLF